MCSARRKRSSAEISTGAGAGDDNNERGDARMTDTNAGAEAEDDRNLV